jgi:hypothetical protein
MFSQTPGEFLIDCFARFESIVSSLHSCGPLVYSDNERAKQLLYALDDHIWGMKITALEEYVDFATLDTEKLFSKLKLHELSRKGRLNHDASLSSKALITSARVGGHDANPTNITASSTLEFALSSLSAASNEQYESILDDEIALLAKKFCALCKFHKERRRSPRGCFECGDTTHFSADCPKRKKLDSSSNKYDYTKWNDYNKGDDKKKYRFEDKKNKFQKMMSLVCAVLSHLNFSSDDSFISEENEKVKCKPSDFTGLCLMGKSSQHISASDCVVTDDLFPEGLSLRVIELENALCNQDRLLCNVFRENKKLNLELESVFSEIASPQSVHDDTSAKPCDNCRMIMVNYATCGWFMLRLQVNLMMSSWNSESSKLVPHCLVLTLLVHCLDLIWRLLSLRLKILSINLSILLVIVSYLCDSLKGKLFHAIKENTKLQQEVAY